MRPTTFHAARLAPRRWLLAAILATAIGCGSTPTSPETPFTSTSQHLGATLSAGGSVQLALTLAESATVHVGLVSVVSVATGAPLTDSLLVRIGTPSGSACTTTLSRDTPPTLTAQMTLPLPGGTYCVVVSAPAGLPEPVRFTVRVRATNGRPRVSSGQNTDLFGTRLAPNASATRTFTTTAAGAMAVTLANAGGENNVLRVEFGVWDGTACRVFARVDTKAGTDPQISVSGDAGTYCVAVSDIGNLTLPINFTATFTFP